MNATPPAPPSREPEKVREMFGSIASRYDLANHILSCGADFLWRAHAARLVKNWHPNRVLDLATGSGDLALSLQRCLPGAEIVAADFSHEMLAVARSKGVRNTVLADALKLPFVDGQFDCVTVAFGLRNMTDWASAIREMRRVLAPGAHLLVLDFSRPQRSLRTFYHFYLHRILPSAAAILTGQKTAYEYLASSIEAFPSGDAMIQLLRDQGFVNTASLPLTGGIATIYTGEARSLRESRV